MDRRYLITVIVPIYKVEEYLDECVTSIVNQTYKYLEIILVDDGSPDRCPQMCDEWAKRDARIKVIHKSNGGLSSARNAGLDIAKGDYIGFVDSDDFIEPEMYERLYSSIITDKKYSVASCSVYKFMNGKKVVFKPQWTVIKEHVLEPNVFAEKLLTESANFTVWSKLYRSNLLKEVRFREGKINEDSLFIFDLSKEIEKQNLYMIEIPYIGYNYRQRPDSICSNTKRPLAIDAIENYLMMYDYYNKSNNKRMAKIIRQYLSVRYVRFADQVLQNKDWRSSYAGVAKDYLQSLTARDVYSMSFRNMAKYFVLLFLPKVYLSLLRCHKRE